MRVLFDDKTESSIKGYNLNIYNNLREIIEMLVVDYGEVDGETLLVKFVGGNKFQLVNKKIREELNLKLEGRNECFCDDYLISFGNEKKFRRYKLQYSSALSKWGVKLYEVVLKKDKSLIIDFLLYSYGKHVDVCCNNVIYSYDIQGRNIDFDLSKFEKLLISDKYFSFETISDCLNSCIISEGMVKIIKKKYSDCCLTSELYDFENEPKTFNLSRTLKK